MRLGAPPISLPSGPNTCKRVGSRCDVTVSMKRSTDRSRFPPLNGRDLGTLLFDRVSRAAAADRRNVFDVGLLAERLEVAARWLDEMHGPVTGARSSRRRPEIP
jgi:hypothetical protein